MAEGYGTPTGGVPGDRKEVIINVPDAAGKKGLTRRQLLALAGGGAIAATGGVAALLKYLENNSGSSSQLPEENYPVANATDTPSPDATPSSDPHVKKISGGYEITGNTAGAGVRVEQKTMKISPGGKAQFVGIIEDDKGIVYFNEEGWKAVAHISCGKSDPIETSIEINQHLEEGLYYTEVGLDIWRELGCDSGDEIAISNFYSDNKAGIKFIFQ